MMHKSCHDNKARRMLDIYARQSFRSASAHQRRRLLLAWWIVQTKVRRNLKYTLDLVLVCLALILVLPIMIIVAIAIKLDSPGPLLFRQTRLGKWGKPFTCYKFRSMYVDAEQRLAELRAFNEADGPVFKMKNDPRITRVGHIIRRTSIDELPQLFNVLRGDMSLVGPRPPLPHEVAQYTYTQLGRLHTIPGVTGLQQVSGRSNIDFERWVELDLQYINEQSLLKDIEILLKTIPAVLLSKGAY
jgi:exopolysaccharide biosynthesis polyprenyl glycosylphosphotransferase